MIASERYIVTETVISSLINTLIGIAALLAVFGLRPAVSLWGAHGLAVNLIPAVFMMTLMDVIVPTLLTRRRIREGRLVVLRQPQSKWLPNRMALRALVLAVALTGVLLPCALVVLRWSGPAVWTIGSLFASQAVLGVLVAVIITPVALRASFNERL
jgi:hypothetical protein